MSMQYTYLLHENGPALWPEHKPLREILDLKATTPTQIFEATYQANPTPLGGSVFLREWWHEPGTRIDIGSPALDSLVIGRWLSFDTGIKDRDTSDYTAYTQFDLLVDYRGLVRRVWRDRKELPQLLDIIVDATEDADRDGKLRGVVIEDKASGTSAYQTLRQAMPPERAALLIPFQPHGSKTQRAEQAAIWCKNGCVLLPYANAAAPWLHTFETELFTFPGSVNDDQVDSMTQIILYLEHLLSEGRRMRQEQTAEDTDELASLRAWVLASG